MRAKLVVVDWPVRPAIADAGQYSFEERLQGCVLRRQLDNSPAGFRK
jgi:hypothetical protein